MKHTPSDMGMAQNYRATVTLVLVVASIYQGAFLVHVFEPQPHGSSQKASVNGTKSLRGPSTQTSAGTCEL